MSIQNSEKHNLPLLLRFTPWMLVVKENAYNCSSLWARRQDRSSSIREGGEDSEPQPLSLVGILRTGT